MSELRRPSSLPPLCVVLTMPVVTVFWRENGLPIATTNSPGLRSADRPNNSTGSFIWNIKQNTKSGFDAIIHTSGHRFSEKVNVLLKRFIKNIFDKIQSLTNNTNTRNPGFTYFWEIALFYVSYFFYGWMDSHVLQVLSDMTNSAKPQTIKQTHNAFIPILHSWSEVLLVNMWFTAKMQPDIVATFISMCWNWCDVLLCTVVWNIQRSWMILQIMKGLNEPHVEATHLCCWD